ncbi:MAG: PspA/IM30 family protein [Acidobacteria bacterium]|nr:PspA/IM30 family protein [Acidobacteriota bacterium]
MALLERVGALLRANLNDLVDKAEDPEIMLKQVILDMQNQLLQVKTQVAMAIADHHLLLKKKQEHEQSAAEWMRKAELAVSKKQDELARAAIERSVGYRKMAENYDQQIADQNVQVENLKGALQKLEMKLAEAQNKVDLLIAQNRRAKAMERAGAARMKLDDGNSDLAFDRMKRKVDFTEAVGQATNELIRDSVDDQFAKLEKEDEIDRLLAELKAKS